MKVPCYCCGKPLIVKRQPKGTRSSRYVGEGVNTVVSHKVGEGVNTVVSHKVRVCDACWKEFKRARVSRVEFAEE